ncbi:MAG: hypothetical protein V3T93_04930 [Alphaproteobacteria bacterium]
MVDVPADEQALRPPKRNGAIPAPSGGPMAVATASAVRPTLSARMTTLVRSLSG